MNALLSVFDKDGLEEFGRRLQDLGFNLYASGGTATALKAAGLPVTDIATMVGEPILGHRVVTLSREIHAGLLATSSSDDAAELERLDVPRFDLVCVDLYPLIQEIMSSEATPDTVIEKTDIGGPTMIRSAAKGRRIVIVDMADRPRVLKWLQAGKPQEQRVVALLAAKAELFVSQYCAWSGVFHLDNTFGGDYIVNAEFLKAFERELQQCSELIARTVA